MRPDGRQVLSRGPLHVRFLRQTMQMQSMTLLHALLIWNVRIGEYSSLQSKPSVDRRILVAQLVLCHRLNTAA